MNKKRWLNNKVKIVIVIIVIVVISFIVNLNMNRTEIVNGREEVKVNDINNINRLASNEVILEDGRRINIEYYGGI